MKGRIQAAEQRHNEAMSLAWHTAALPLTKRFPKLKDLLIDGQKPAPDASQGAGNGAQILDALLSLQAQGAPMNIRKLH